MVKERRRIFPGSTVAKASVKDFRADLLFLKPGSDFMIGHGIKPRPCRDKGLPGREGRFRYSRLTSSDEAGTAERCPPMASPSTDVVQHIGSDNGHRGRSSRSCLGWLMRCNVGRRADEVRGRGDRVAA